MAEQEFSFSKALQVAESTAADATWTSTSAGAEATAQLAVKMVAVVGKTVVAAKAKPQATSTATPKWSMAVPHSEWEATVNLTVAMASDVEVQVTERVAAAAP